MEDNQKKFSDNLISTIMLTKESGLCKKKNRSKMWKDFPRC